MKNKILILVAVLFALICFTACGSEANDPQNGTTQSDVTETTSSVGQENTDIEIVKDGKAVYKIVYSAEAKITDPSIEAAKKIADTVKSATGVTLTVGTDVKRQSEQADPTTFEILVGVTNHEESSKAVANMEYDDYHVDRDGNKLVVVSFTSEGYSRALGRLCAEMTARGKKGELTIDGDFEFSGSIEAFEIFDGIPIYDPYAPVSIIDLADQNYMIHIPNAKSEGYTEYREKLEDNGFELYAENEIGENLFATYTDDGCVLNCYYTVNDNAVRIIAEPDDTVLPQKSGSYTKVCDPAFRIVGLEFYGKDSEGVYNQIGLFMVWRLSDGRLIVVDGGGHYSSMGTKIYNVLYDMAPDKNNITVAAWIFTHAHGDHVGGFIKFAESSNAKKVKVENFIFNFGKTALYDSFEGGEDRGRLEQCRTIVSTKYPNSNVIKAHSGQVFHFADMEIEMLYTIDDNYPEKFKCHNATSLVFRVNIGGKSFMALGDEYTTTSDLLVARYGNELKSDIVQVSHHGYAGGTVALYNKIDPDIVFWPGGDHAFETLSKKAYNKHLLNNLGIKALYIAGKDRMYTFTLPNDYLKADEQLAAA